MSLKTTPYDVVEHLRNDEEIAAYLAAALEDAADDPAYITQVLGDVARAHGMTKLARETGLTREGLYKSLSENGNPSFTTVNKIVHALGFKLTLQPV